MFVVVVVVVVVRDMPASHITDLDGVDQCWVTWILLSYWYKASCRNTCTNLQNISGTDRTVDAVPRTAALHTENLYRFLSMVYGRYRSLHVNCGSTEIVPDRLVFLNDQAPTGSACPSGQCS